MIQKYYFYLNKQKHFVAIKLSYLINKFQMPMGLLIFKDIFKNFKINISGFYTVRMVSM